jgi:hypothetical protein
MERQAVRSPGLAAATLANFHDNFLLFQGCL